MLIYIINSIIINQLWICIYGYCFLVPTIQIGDKSCYAPASHTLIVDALVRIDNTERWNIQECIPTLDREKEKAITIT